MSEPVKCAHCSASGTCSNGENGLSCHICADNHFPSFKKNGNKENHKGLICSVCQGVGIAELKTDRMNKTIIPYLSQAIVFVTLILVFFIAYKSSAHHAAILTFSGTLIGSVTGYYYAGKKKSD